MQLLLADEENELACGQRLPIMMMIMLLYVCKDGKQWISVGLSWKGCTAGCKGRPLYLSMLPKEGFCHRGNL